MTQSQPPSAVASPVSMIDKVAEAICDAGREEAPIWKQANENIRQSYRAEAKAQIMAMRDPTPEMDDVIGADILFGDGRARQIWTEFIDAILGRTD